MLRIVTILLALAFAAPPAVATTPAPTYVGSQACASCHQAETRAWHGSHHDLAMQEATPATVLGDFDDATFVYGTVRSRFFRRDGRFFVTTDGPDGKLADFEIRYTFGVYPLQQYLIVFPGGRLQALGIAWDARPKEEGGQRWFHLYPGQNVHAGESIHWTGRDQVWNFMCAECHSTDLVKGYDAATDTYKTRWAEIDVACEACHGPGSAHVAWAGSYKGSPSQAKPVEDGLTVHFDAHKSMSWTIDPVTGNARRSTPIASATELETCGMCHSRRGQIHEPWRPGHQLLDTHLTSLLEPGLFEADGVMVDEVYNYQSFRQSRMFSKGVTCSDCHDPHSLQLHAQGDGVCFQCHEEQKYAAVAHHGHEPGSPGSRCIACHMPARTYMVVDVRHDHSFRIPRPDLTERYGVSNTCNDCHTDKSAAWADVAITRWHGPERKGFQTWTPAFSAAWHQQPDAGDLLARLLLAGATPGIARATALEDLAPYLTADRLPLVQQGLAAPDPLVRLGALRSLGLLPIQARWQLASPLLGDPVRGVRVEAVGLLADMPAAQIPETDRASFDHAAADYVAAQELNADRPEGRVNLASFFARRGQPAEAEKTFRDAIGLWPDFVPAYVDLAALYASERRDADGERVLRDAIAIAPGDATLAHALGLNLVRQQRTTEAVQELRRATELAPDDARFAYVYAIALNATGQGEEALRVLEANQTRHPGDRDTLVALVTINRDRGDLAAARAWAEKLVAIDPRAQALLDQLR